MTVIDQGLIRPEALWAAEPDIHPDQCCTDHERRSHIAARIADETERDIRQMLMRIFPHRHQVSEDLRRMKFIRQPVVDIKTDQNVFHTTLQSRRQRISHNRGGPYASGSGGQ